MRSHSGRYVVVFNGEIYNHREMRAQLDREYGDRPWRGHSDTEVFLAAIEEMGLRRALEAAVGMFAFGLWDRRENAGARAGSPGREAPLLRPHRQGLCVRLRTQGLSSASRLAPRDRSECADAFDAS